MRHKFSFPTSNGYNLLPSQVFARQPCLFFIVDN